MKRDMDLVREILRRVRSLETFDRPVWIAIEGQPQALVSYHIQIMAEYGLLDAISLGSNDGPDWRPLRLTWDGQDFLDAAENDTRWQRAREIMGQAQGFGFEILKQVLMDLARQQVTTLMR